MKRNIGAVNALYPSLTTIVGAVVEGKPNFLAVAHVGILNHGQPQYVSFGINVRHYTGPGIREHGEFSVNIPSTKLVVETDYVGIVSGKKTDKSGVFDVYYGELEHAPLIAACPVAMECRLHDVLDYKTHEIFVGEIVATHVEEAVLTDDKVDVRKVEPLLFDMNTLAYYSLGETVAPCWSVGKRLKERS